MDRMLGSVYVNDIQNNPLQPDINYRGYTASPLLGTPQGLSVYMDGVRLNQPFGDVVSWDLIPRVAISSLDADSGLESAVRPEYARRRAVRAHQGRLRRPRQQRSARLRLRQPLAARIRDRRSRGKRAQLVCRGRPSRRGRLARRLPSNASQLLGKIGWRGAATDSSLTGAYADTDLNGNGLQEQRFLADDYASVYTKPDNTQNQSSLFNLTARHDFERAAVVLRQPLPSRHQDVDDQRRHQRGLAGRERLPADSAEQAALAAAGYTGFPTSGENAVEHAVPVLALHRQRAAQHRAEREVQRALQPHAHRAERHRRRRASSRGARSIGGRRTSSPSARRTTRATHISRSRRSSATSPGSRRPTVDGRASQTARRTPRTVRRARRPDGRTHTMQRVRERLRRSELAL